MRADFKVFLDACVLANYGVCDLLLRLAEHPRQYLPIWSDEVLNEVYRTHTEKLRWPEKLALSFREALQAHFPESFSRGYEHLIPAVTNAPEDRHVLAAAARAGAEIILTFNLKDFPDEALTPWSIRKQHPQDYLQTLYELDRIQVVSRITAIATSRGESQEDVLIRLGNSVPVFASRLLDDLALG